MCSHKVDEAINYMDVNEPNKLQTSFFTDKFIGIITSFLALEFELETLQTFVTLQRKSIFRFCTSKRNFSTCSFPFAANETSKIYYLP